MSKIIIFLFSIITLLIAEDKMLWDLGVIIKSKDSCGTNELIKPLIANTQIVPSYNSTNQLNIFSISDLSIHSNHIIKLLSLNNEYFKLTEYIKNMDNESDALNDEQRFIYADALYQINNYQDAINHIKQLSNHYPLDEKYFTLALYNQKAGNKHIAKTFLDKLIVECPNSEYFKLAKLQTQKIK